MASDWVDVDEEWVDVDDAETPPRRQEKPAKWFENQKVEAVASAADAFDLGKRGAALIQALKGRRVFRSGDKIGALDMAEAIPLKDRLSLYSQNLGELRGHCREAEKKEPAMAMVGGAAPFVLAGPAGLATTFGLGAASGAAKSEHGPIGAPADFAKDVASEAALSGVGYGVGKLVGKAAKAAAPHVARGVNRGAQATADKLDDFAIDRGRRVLLGGGTDSLSKRAELPEAAVLEAYESGAIRPFKTTQFAREQLEQLTQKQREQYAEILKQLKAQGVDGPDAMALARRLAERGRELMPRTGANKAVPEAFLSEASNIAAAGGRGTPGALKIRGGRRFLDLDQAEDIKRTLQRQAKYGKIDETQLNEARREIAAAVREANEAAVEQAGQAAGEGSHVRALADQFVPTKQRLGRLIEARNAARRGSARAAQRSEMGLPEHMHAAAQLAAGSPVGAVAAPAASNLLKNRGSSAAGVGALRLSRLLRGVDPRAPQTDIGPFGARLLSGALRGGDELADELLLADADELERQRAISAALRR